MKTDKDLTEKLRRLFTTHPTVETFFVTSDGQAFTEEHRADGRAQKLKDKEIVTANREDYERPEESKVAKVAVAPDADETKTGTDADQGSGTDADQGTGTDSDQGAGTDAGQGSEADKGTGTEAPAADEKTALVAKYTLLFGKKPSHFSGVEKLKADIAKKEAEAK